LLTVVEFELLGFFFASIYSNLFLLLLPVVEFELGFLFLLEFFLVLLTVVEFELLGFFLYCFGLLLKTAFSRI